MSQSAACVLLATDSADTPAGGDSQSAPQPRYKNKKKASQVQSQGPVAVGSATDVVIRCTDRASADIIPKSSRPHRQCISCENTASMNMLQSSLSAHAVHRSAYRCNASLSSQYESQGLALFVASIACCCALNQAVPQAAP